MAGSLVWISGASAGIGRALVETVPWDGARVIGISRRAAPGVEHLEADLSDPSSWAKVTASFREELKDFSGGAVAFFHAAGAIDPIGFAAEVDTDAYTRTVLLDSAAPQVLGQAFVAAAAPLEARKYLLNFTSGAASTVYPGWSAYGAGKAAVDQWTRDVGAEQDVRGGVRVLAVGPGTVDTGMQERVRQASEHEFPQRQKFIDLHEQGKLTDPDDVARRLWELLDADDVENGAVLDLRQRGG